ncbi:unnamed protein product, partial [marine sediment metagenome]
LKNYFGRLAYSTYYNFSTGGKNKSIAFFGNSDLFFIFLKYK